MNAKNKTQSRAGKQYAGIMLVEKIGMLEKGGSVWLCRCKCGKELTLPLKNVASGRRWCSKDCPARPEKTGSSNSLQLRTRHDRAIYRVIMQLAKHEHLADRPKPRQWLPDEIRLRYERILTKHIEREQRRMRRTWSTDEAFYRRTGIPQCEREEAESWQPTKASLRTANRSFLVED